MYRITFTAAQGGRHSHVRRAFLDVTPEEAIAAAWEERYGSRPWRIISRDNNPGAYSVLLPGGGVTFTDVEKDPAP